MIHKYPVNEQGRDFVIGDLHGSYSRLEALMNAVQFDKTKDRLFSVGDLVDRGPNNEDSLRLLNWAHVVLGNHEHMMSDYYNGIKNGYGAFWVRNGGQWGDHYRDMDTDTSNEMKSLVKKVEELPLMITVDMKDGRKFHVIHAEFSATGPITDADLADPEKFGDAAFSQTMDGDFITWGRYLFYMLHSRTITPEFLEMFQAKAKEHKMKLMFNPELSPIYSGHTTLQQPTRFIGQTNIDTKAYGSYEEGAPEWMGLTMTEPLTDRFWLSNANGVYETTPLIFTEEFLK